MGKKGTNRNKKRQCIFIGKEKRVQEVSWGASEAKKTLYNALDTIFIPKFMWLKFSKTNEWSKIDTG